MKIEKLLSRPQSVSGNRQVEESKELGERWRRTGKSGAKLEPSQHQATSTCNKYHRAAADGYIDMLCEASKRDTNAASELNGSLTPTLLAARGGHLEALRILVGRGGDPERTSCEGSSALHLAAARNHLNCVSFLVNFGANMWSLDNELHTAKDVAAINQAKEVLDYLDQMMAKQSALNTKSVQKLKEKAKIGAEKRLKRMRKAQLKAIKQAEKDERYLVRLSNNRRLLKAAHSISDIKLVGRTPLLGPNQLNQQLESKADGGRLSSSPSLANFLNHKLSLDLLGQRQAQQNGNNRKQINFMLSSASNSAADDSSAYSTASISTGYLSCSSAGALARSAHHLDRIHQQPKYSDLVAVKSADVGAGAKTPKQLSLKSSNSTLAAKLWGLGSGGGGGGGGVSRKVQLKRMLLVTNSNHDLYTASDAGGGQPAATGKNGKLVETSLGGGGASGRATPAPGAGPNSSSGSGAKLCTVQPTIKLKMHGNSGNTDLRQEAASIKWPPAPSMPRAVSEPDFGAALRQDSGDEHDDAGSRASSVCSLVNMDRDEADEQGDTSQEEAKRKLGGGGGQPDESQHQLLTQCLSQLKLRHEAISRGRDETLRPSKVVAAQRRLRELQAAARLPGSNPAIFGHSDELIQLRQCVNGLGPDVPLKPSAIKLQQQQQQHRLGETNAKGLADSIGSAGSFADRNSRLSVGSSQSDSQSNGSSSGSSGKLSASSPSSTYSSTYTSSIELLRQPPIGAAMPPLPPPPPPPPPLPPPPPPLLAAHQSADEDLEAFLGANGLPELGRVFADEQIDLEALMLLSEDDLKSLSVLLGPRRKLLKAIEERRMRLAAAAAPSKSPVYLMVDTPL